jgi:CheY-like chemotaxis protein
VHQILLVEDLTPEREIIAAALESRGARVIAVANDDEAYARLRRTKGKDISALVTDINLGRGTTGFDVARAARKIRGDLAVVYISAMDVEPEPHAVPRSAFIRRGDSLGATAVTILERLDDLESDRAAAGGLGRASAAQA